MNAIGKVILAAPGLGLACGIAVGIAMYVCIGDRYTAYSLLHISMQTESLVGGDAPLVDRDRFDIYKNTQRVSLLSRWVLLSALRKPEVKDIPIVQEKTLYGDPVEWLAGKLSVSFPGDAEIMTVSLTLEDPKEAQALVKAVVDSYMNEVVLAETEQKRRRLDELEKICGDKEQQIRGKREELKGLVGSSIGSDDPDSLRTRQRLVIEELAIYRNEKAKIDFEIAKLKGELAAQRALLKQIDTASADPGELETLVNSDPPARELSAKLAKEPPDQPRDKGAANKGATISSEQAKSLRAQYDARVKELGQKVREKQHAVVMRKIVELEAQLKSMEEARAVTAARIGKLTEEARNTGQTVDIQMIHSQLRNMEQSLGSLVAEREKLEVAIKSTPRIAVVEPAELPLTPSNAILRLVLATAAALATFFCVAAVVILSYALIRLKRTVAG